MAAVGAGATAYAAYTGKKVGQLARQHGEVDVQDANTPTAQTPPDLAAWQKKQRAAQYLVPLLSGANIVLNSYLVQTYRPGATLRGLGRRVLPG